MFTIIEGRDLEKFIVIEIDGVEAGKIIKRMTEVICLQQIMAQIKGEK